MPEEAARMESHLREHRVNAGISQEQLARRVDVSRQTIVNIEKGITIPNVLLALAIAAALTVAVDVLFKAVRQGR